jgi:hypothetical protein
MKELEEVRGKVEMFVIKYDLKGSSLVEKMSALDEHVRSLMGRYEK